MAGQRPQKVLHSTFLPPFSQVSPNFSSWPAFLPWHTSCHTYLAPVLTFISSTHHSTINVWFRWFNLVMLVLFLGFGVCMSMWHVCTCEHSHMQVHRQVESWGWFQEFPLECFWPYILKQGLSLNSKLSDSASQLRVLSYIKQTYVKQTAVSAWPLHGHWRVWPQVLKFT